MVDLTDDMDVAAGHKGYVDDHIDLDDNDEGSSDGETGSHGGQPGAPAAEAIEISDEEPKATDFLMRPAAREDREILLANFRLAPPDLQKAERVRIYRAQEGTEKGFKRARLRQTAYEKSYLYALRQKRNAARRIPTFNHRGRQEWFLEVVREGLTPSLPPPPPIRGEKASYPPEANVYRGTYDSQSGSSKYALMFMNADGRHVDVIPLKQGAWHTFRTLRGGSTNGTDVEASWKSANKKGDQRIKRLQMRFQEVQAVRETLQGGVLQAKKQGIDVLKIPGMDKGGGSSDDGDTGMDYEREFDNNDVLQVDAEEAKVHSHVSQNRDLKKDQIEFVRMIKDVQKDEDESSLDSDSEEEEDLRDITVLQRISQVKLNVDHGSGSGSTNEEKAVLSHLQPRLASTSEKMSRSVGSQKKSPKISKLLVTEVKDLVPPAGTLPTENHILSVLNKLMKHKKSEYVRVQELTAYFERSTEKQKSNLMKIIKNVCVLQSNPTGAKGYVLSPKRN